MSWRTYIHRKVRDDFAGNQRALAREAGASPEDVNRWLRTGRTPRPETAIRIITALGDRFEDVSSEVYALDDPIEREIINSSAFSETQKEELLSHLRRIRHQQQKGEADAG